MRKKDYSKKLALKKVTIADLGRNTMAAIHAGGLTVPPTEGACPSNDSCQPCTGTEATEATDCTCPRAKHNFISG